MRNVLPDAPQDTSRINDNEIANSPRPVCRRLDLHAIFGCEIHSADMAPPSFHILDQQMHHETIRVLPLVEVLQKKTRITLAEVCQVLGRPNEVESQVLIEPLEKSEIPGRHVSLCFDCFHVAHVRRFHCWMDPKHARMFSAFGCTPTTWPRSVAVNFADGRCEGSKTCWARAETRCPRTPPRIAPSGSTS